MLSPAPVPMIHQPIGDYCRTIRINCVQRRLSVAGNLPIGDKSFDAAVATFTHQQWPDLKSWSRRDVPRQQAEVSDMATVKKSVVMIYAAGSLRYVLPPLVSAFTGMTGATAETRHGPAGLLRERIEAGERPDIFLSANFAHPARLAELGLTLPPVVFARNTMAAAVRRTAGFSTINFVDRLLDPTIGIATSTPLKDPSGDYAWAIFRRIEAIRPGSFAVLDAKAQKLVGGSETANTPGRYDPISAALTAGTVHVFLGYRTGLEGLTEETPDIDIVEIPADVNVVPEYALATLKGASPAGMAFALFTLSSAGQNLLREFGFQPVALSQGS